MDSSLELKVIKSQSFHSQPELEQHELTNIPSRPDRSRGRSSEYQTSLETIDKMSESDDDEMDGRHRTRGRLSYQREALATSVIPPSMWETNTILRPVSKTSHASPRRNVFWEADPEGPGLCALILTAFAALLLVITLPFSLCTCIKVVTEYERAVIFRLGRLRKGGAKGPGIFFIIPCTDSYQKVDLRTVSFDVPPQEVLSRDSVTVSVDAVVYYRVSNPTMATNNIEDYSHSTRLLAATTLRNVLGTKNLAEILSERESISHVMQTSLDDATDPWGVKVERVEIKDVRLPVQLQRAMAAEAEAAREARAKVIAAEGEQKASKALREAADTIADSHSALQLRYLQTLNSISAEKNSTIIFPFPMELVSQWGIKPTNSKAIASS
ncbi:band 7 protein AGAP004871-like isoform X2 [Tigriopus californicus]|uniref:band 7 protein AGAP004871-like isoform X2 n=1 Tax=Tigriopus californicus TaxID=6832 RepID=UPI0027DA72C1|nr:band 7 protein AGAP004871-like isoform X2 [Tigriopus californicus]